MRCLRPPAPPRKPSFQDLFPVIPQVTASAGSGSMSLAASRRRTSLTGLAYVGRRRSSCAAAVELIHRRRPSTLFVGGFLHRKLDSDSGIDGGGDGGRILSTGWHFSASGLVGAGRRRRRLSTIDERVRGKVESGKQTTVNTCFAEGEEEDTGTSTASSANTVLPVVVEECETSVNTSPTNCNFTNPCQTVNRAVSGIRKSNSRRSVINNNKDRINEIVSLTQDRPVEVGADETVEVGSPSSCRAVTPNPFPVPVSSGGTHAAVSSYIYINEDDVEDRKSVV